MPAFFDAHCHIAQGKQAVSADPVRGRMLCGTGPEDWGDVARAAAEWPGTIPAFGLHPWSVGAGLWLETLETLLADHAGAWLGEAGLDGIRVDVNSRPEQERVFSEQLRLADRLGRSVNLHCVKAHEPLLRILDAEYLRGGPRDFVVHSFSGPYQFVKKFAERGAYFTAGQLFLRRDSRKDRERMALISEDRLLLESDAELTPQRDARVELERALAWLANARGAGAEALAERIDTNAKRLFAHE